MYRCLRNLFLTGASASILWSCGGSTAPSPDMPQARRADADRSAILARAEGTYKIYVANIGNNTITTYLPNGTQTTPTVEVSGTNYLFSMTVDGNGKIYALSANPLQGQNAPGYITTYTPDGSPTTPSITVPEKGYSTPTGIAIDNNGKIYVLSSAHDGSDGVVFTYKPDGTRTTPTFKTGPDSSSLAIDAEGKIYVTNAIGQSAGSLTTYNADGKPTAPTITRGIHGPSGVAVDANGTIYVADSTQDGENGPWGYVTTYTRTGRGPLERVRNGLGGLGGVAVARDGTKIYVAASTANTSSVKTYAAGGKRIDPTITDGLDEPSAIALH